MGMPADFRETIIKPGLAKGWLIRLLPGHDVYLWVHKGDGARFANLFRDTWRRIPIAARRRMLAYWRNNFAPPHIELANRWIGQVGRGLRATWADVFQRGHQIRFYSRIVAAMPDHIVHDLIAHELAHVFQYASGWPPGETSVDGDSMEFDADELMENWWGFSASAMDDWAIEAGIVKARNVSEREAMATALHFVQTGERKLPARIRRKLKG